MYNNIRILPTGTAQPTGCVRDCSGRLAMMMMMMGVMMVAATMMIERFYSGTR